MPFPDFRQAVPCPIHGHGGTMPGPQAGRRLQMHRCGLQGLGHEFPLRPKPAHHAADVADRPRERRAGCSDPRGAREDRPTTAAGEHTRPWRTRRSIRRALPALTAVQAIVASAPTTAVPSKAIGTCHADSPAAAAMRSPTATAAGVRSCLRYGALRE